MAHMMMTGVCDKLHVEMKLHLTSVPLSFLVFIYNLSFTPVCVTFTLSFIFTLSLLPPFF